MKDLAVTVDVNLPICSSTREYRERNELPSKKGNFRYSGVFLA